MDADLQQAHQFNLNPIPTSGLTRYKSAPSSYFSNFVMEYKDVNDFLRPPPPKPLSPQIDRIFAQLASEISGNNNNLNHQMDTCHTSNNNPAVVVPVPVPVMKLEIEPTQASSPVVAFTPSAALPPPHPLSRTSSGVGSSHIRGLKASAPPVRIPVVEKQSSTTTNNNNNLVRHSSLPAGLFSQIDVHNAGAAYFGNNNQQQAANSSSEMMSAYSGILGDDNIKQRHDDVLDDYMINGFWNDSSTSPEKLLSGVKRERADDDFLSVDDVKPFSSESNTNTQIGDLRKAGAQTGMLSHHLSLPKSSLEMLSAMEKFLELQDSTVAIGTRAKRGCATHPRSIAERVRRTKISERMRRLQELVPNMDKQTNTSDMLDLAVEYIKDLQTRVQILKACSEKCTC